MAPEKLREIAAAGGARSHRKVQRSHEWSKAEAVEAGKRGAAARRERQARMEKRIEALRVGLARYAETNGRGSIAAKVLAADDKEAAL
jgi:hypothetical protein